MLKQGNVFRHLLENPERMSSKGKPFMNILTRIRLFQKVLIIAIFLLILSGNGILGNPSAPNTKSGEAIQWHHWDLEGNLKVNLYFFWSNQCPHCQKAKAFLAKLGPVTPWLELHSMEVDSDPENRKRFIQMGKRMNQSRLAVPAFVYCKKFVLGFGSDKVDGDNLVRQLESCKERILKKGTDVQSGTPNLTESNKITLPLWGQLDASKTTLPVLTLVIAGVDAFNPCAFFVLLFLLSLLIHAKSRKRMVLIGGVFIACSGLVYFLFMAAWLNLFLVLEELKWVTRFAGLLGIFIASINIKDYFWFRQGISLSIPDTAKPKLFERMRQLTGASSLPTLLVSTVVLAIVANAYELLCTFGFPMVFTRILTLNELPLMKYYLYLAFYNLVYVIPLLIILILFIFALGSRKLSERQGRILKLLSGCMMGFLGILLLAAPELLTNLFTAIGLLAVAVLTTFVIILIDRKRNITA